MARYQYSPRSAIHAFTCHQWTWFPSTKGWSPGDSKKFRAENFVLSQSFHSRIEQSLLSSGVEHSGPRMLSQNLPRTSSFLLNAFGLSFWQAWLSREDVQYRV